MDAFNVSKKIVQLRWNNQFEEALHLFKENFNNKLLSVDFIISDIRLVSAIIDSLKQQDKQKEAIDFLIDTLKINDRNISDTKFFINIAWLFCDAYKKNAIDKLLFEKYFRLIDKTISILSTVNAEKILTKLLFETTEYFYSENSNKSTQFIKLFDYIDPENLSEVSTKYKGKIKGNEKEIELASERENYYMLKSKLYYSSGEYENCIQICEKALNTINGFHYGNDVWLGRRIALCLKCKDNINEAVKRLEVLLNKKKEWFLMKEIAELYEILKQRDNSLKFAIDALLKNGYSSYKVKLIDFLIDITQYDDKFNTLNQNLIILQYLIRSENKWKITIKPTISTTENSLEVYEKIVKICKNIFLLDEPEIIKTTGTITRILHEGKSGDGFITDKNGRSIYFRFLSAKINAKDIIRGLSVEVKAKLTERNGKKVWTAFEIKKNVD